MKRLIVAAAFAGAVAASPAAAAVKVLTFSGDICADGACSNGSAISQAYGDGAGVDVGYAVFTFTGNPSALDIRYWDLGYGDLQGVVWAGTNQTDYKGRITLTALPGYEIALRSFDIAAFDSVSTSSPVLIESLGGTGILDEAVDTQWPTHNHVAVDSGYFTDGIVLNWGPDSFNVGLDNITFEVRAVGGDAVPEPATWAMLILGFGATGSLLRRRRALAA